MTLEDWSTVFQFASVILLGLTFAIGAGAIWTSYLVGKRQQERIATAGQQAAEANEKAAKATEGTAKALADAANANERAGKIELEAAQQRERAANAERELLELQEQMKPRRLTAEQRSRMLQALKKGENRALSKRFVVWWPSHNQEPEQFGRDIWNVLTTAGWTVFPVFTDLWFFTPVPVGIKIETTISASDTAEVLYEALEAAGIEYGGGELRKTGDKLLPDDVILLKIGVKPTISRKDKK